jgi:serine protease Do
MFLLSVGAQQPPRNTRQYRPADNEKPADSLAILQAAETAVQQAIERAAPSVVAIGRFRREGGGRRDALRDLNFNIPGMGRPFANMMVEDVLPTEFGSGVIISEDGAILTCYHLIDDPEENNYYVWTSDQTDPQTGMSGTPRIAQLVRKPAEVRAGDPWTDLAVLKIDARDLPVMPIGDAGTLRRGSFVVSLGNPYATARDGQASASFGMVSNLQRRAPRLRESSNGINPAESLQEFGTLIQTDAKLNLGSSGGALINIKGELVGLTTSLAAIEGYEQAAGYAIPIDGPALKTIADLREGRLPSFGFLGVEPIDVGAGQGALVRRVVPGMAGEQAGLRPGDVIVEVDAMAIANAEDLFREMSRRAADAEVQLRVVSRMGDGNRTLVARLGKKRLALARPGYSQIPEPSWRGMLVDLASALPPDRLMRGNLAQSGDAAVVRVDPDSPAWKAGVRPGVLVLKVNETQIDRPDDFLKAIEQSEDQPVTLELSSRAGESTRVVVKSE